MYTQIVGPKLELRSAVSERDSEDFWNIWLSLRSEPGFIL